MSIQRRSDELVDLLRPDFVSNDGTASPTFTDESLTGSHRASVSVGVRVYRSVNQLIGPAAWVMMIFDTQRWDDPDNTMWAVAPNPTRLTCQIEGIYVISGSVRWEADGGAAGLRQLAIWLNATVIIADQMEPTVNVGTIHQSVTSTYKLVVGNFVELGGVQTTGGNLNVLASLNYSPEFSMVRVA